MASQEHNGRFMEDMTVQDMILALEQTRTAILACGGTEQHGYHLPLSTDYLVAYEVSGANAQEVMAEFGKTLYDEMVETLVDLVRSMEQNAG